ncbi:hypothetical protein [Nocardia aurantia]|uniref:Uncharacterized protein n=1 Tax=Nocardia aurantia TaxID=2585199 RepID=A0A7K0DXL6_9NOCA|nr:hypothetical protein [Nocardia aurantia]MQY30455.1 hypothetical protein [Nocardia aurantia]
MSPTVPELETRVAALEADRAQTTAALTAIAATTARTGEQADRIVAQLDRHEQRFDAVDARFDGIDRRFAETDERTERRIAESNAHVDKHFAATDERAQRWIAESNARLDERFTETDARADRRIAELNERMDKRFAESEAQFTDRFRQLMTAINALGSQSRERQDQQDLRISRVEQQVLAADARSRSVEESLAEIRDLLVRALDRG